MAFAKKMAETKLAGPKEVEPKLQEPGREAEESVRHWWAYRRHIRLVGQEIDKGRLGTGGDGLR
jgi:hypothetical protein